MLWRVILTTLIAASLMSFKEDPSQTYIAQYKEIAISEMHRTGIPASIKLAQALLESGAGKSSLASEANNHFGIKCGGKWNGGTYYLHDDDYNKEGKLIKSCFREFSSPTESFIEHSNFLVNQNRYTFLFNYDHRDYHAWAKGLKKAGYATDKAYPSKLINIIEKYQLFFLDDMVVDDLSVPIAYEEFEDSPDDIIIGQTKSHFEYGTANEDTESQSNRKAKDSRSRKYRKSSKTHVVASGQTIAEIARLYNLEENSIRLRNRIPKDGEPLAGETLYLRKKISLNKRPQFTRIPGSHDIASQEEFIF